MKNTVKKAAPRSAKLSPKNQSHPAAQNCEGFILRTDVFNFLGVFRANRQQPSFGQSLSEQ
ncbi:MAG: hypothetical protein ABIN91_15040 [Mucilaginibacter sp.]|uniref:hypothetical protein n=1 Tax=Mucilaginibacter sp. TaxID=1882438 RepID=UPI003264DBE0